MGSSSHLQLADGLKRERHTQARCARRKRLLLGDSPRGTPSTRIHGTYWCAGVARFALTSNSSPAHGRGACSGPAKACKQLSMTQVHAVYKSSHTLARILRSVRDMGRLTQLAIHALPEALLIQLGMAGACLQHLIISAAEGRLFQAQQEDEEVLLAPACTVNSLIGSSVAGACTVSIFPAAECKLR